MDTQKCLYQSPVGELFLEINNDGALTHLLFTGSPSFDRDMLAGIDPDVIQEGLSSVVQQLDEYFSGKRRDFELPLAPSGTEFQEKVWEALRTIPYGETISYRELARRVGNPDAARAVGLANGKNPISIIIPCHRVIMIDGSLGGYSGGIGIKEKLLALEQSQSIHA